MSIVLRIFLIVGSLAFAMQVIRKIRASTIEIGDALFWIVFSFLLLLISIFPGIIFAAAGLCGIEQPVNMVFLLVIALLVYKVLSLSIKVSALSMKLKTLAATLAAQRVIDARNNTTIIPESTHGTINHPIGNE